MSKNYGIDGDDPDELVFYEDDIKPTRTKPKKKYRRSREIVFNDYEAKEDLDQEERTVYIKEFDLNSIPPQSVNDKSGVKIVMIGKPGCFAPGTEILMFDGSVKNVEDVIVGDKVMGEDGTTPRVVQKLYHDNDEMFKIIPNKGDSYTVNRLHDLVLVACRDHGTKHKKGDIIEISVEEYLKQNEAWKHTFKLFKCPGISAWEEKDTIIEPCFLGVWLADNKTNNINNIEDSYNYYLDFIRKLQQVSKIKSLDKNIFESYFEKYNLVNNKHIPQIFKINSRKIRVQILYGLLENLPGYRDIYNDYVLSLENTILTEDVLFLIRSLGFAASKISENKIIIHDIKVLQHLLNKEIIDIEKLENTFKVESVGQGEYYGFGLDGNRRFCLASFEVVKNTGKSTVIQDIIASKAHITPVAQIFSGTEDSNHFYSEKFPGICVFNKLDEKAVENFVTRQKAAMKYLDNPWAIQIIDDCTDDPKILTKPLFQSYYKNGRHWKMIHILSLQYCLDIRPNIRTNIDYTFILRETNLKNRKSLHENYAGCIDNFQDFCDIMDQITEDYTALVINNRVQSNKIEDCVFWYKAKPDRLPPNWKFGHPSAWDFHHERFDTNFQESFT